MTRRTKVRFSLRLPHESTVNTRAGAPPTVTSRWFFACEQRLCCWPWSANIWASEKVQQIDPAKLAVREAVLLAQFAVATERAARSAPSEALAHREAETRASGADILQTLREAPDLLDLARQIDEPIEAAETGD